MRAIASSSLGTSSAGKVDLLKETTRTAKGSWQTHSPTVRRLLTAYRVPTVSLMGMSFSPNALSDAMLPSVWNAAIY